MAEIEKRHGNLDRAVEYLTTYMSLSDDRRELVLFRLGGLYLDFKNWESGADTFRVFLAEFPLSAYKAEGSLQFSYALYRLSQYADAIALIDTQLETAQAGAFTSDFLLLKAVLHKKAGDLVGAIESLQEYLPLQPTDSKAKMDLIKLYFRQRNFDRVILEIEKVQEMEPFSDPTSSYFLIARHMLG